MNQPTAASTDGLITPATPMPQALTSLTIDSASSIPVSSSATNPVPTGLSLSSPLDAVVPASANVPVESSSVAQPSDQETFSVLESIE